MKTGNSYENRTRRVYRIVAILVCIALVAAAVAFGVISTIGIGYAETLTEGVATSPATETPDDSGTDDTPDADDSDAAGDDSGSADTDDSDDDSDDPAPPKAPVQISITSYPKEMNVGDRKAIDYELENADPGATVKWKSSDDDVASIDSDGTVRALAEGKVEITATVGSAKASVLITVTKKVIEPKSFTVEVEEFGAEDMLLSKHDLKIGDKLHLTVKVDPEDATLEGASFEWKVSSKADEKAGEDADADVATVTPAGDMSETAVLKAVAAGEATLTVSYKPAEDTEDADADDETMKDYKLVVLVAAEEKSPVNFLLIAVFIAIIAVIIVVLIVILNGRKKRRLEEERRARAAKKKREQERLAKTRQEERARLREEGYERGYRDSEADQFERATRVFEAPPVQTREQPPLPGQEAPPQSSFADEAPGDEPAGDGEPDRPFSIDDIE